MTTAKSIPSVSVTYARTGRTARSNELGMRPMQERAWEKRGEQYLLIKSPPASGKSRAHTFIALDKLENQGLRQAVIVVPEKTIGASFSDVLTNIPGIHALTAWRRYNDGAGVEQRIEELAQISTGKTAVNDLGGNALLWNLAALAYQTAPTLPLGLLADSPAEADPPVAAPASREADHPWTQELTSSCFAPNPSASASSLRSGDWTTISRPRHPSESGDRVARHTGRTRDPGPRVSSSLPLADVRP